jgi:hypothetical protein
MRKRRLPSYLQDMVVEQIQDSSAALLQPQQQQPQQHQEQQQEQQQEQASSPAVSGLSAPQLEAGSQGAGEDAIGMPDTVLLSLLLEGCAKGGRGRSLHALQQILPFQCSLCPQVHTSTHPHIAPCCAALSRAFPAGEGDVVMQGAAAEEEGPGLSDSEQEEEEEEEDQEWVHGKCVVRGVNNGEDRFISLADMREVRLPADQAADSGCLLV